MRKMKKVFIIMLAVFLIPFISAWAGELPTWVTEWQSFAQQVNDTTLIELGERLSDPNGVKLGKAWAEYMGFHAPGYIKKNDPAPEIKPGLVITSENYEQYPGLKKLLSPELYDSIKPDALGGVGKMTIVPTIHLYPSKGRQEFVKKYEGQSKIVGGFNMENWKGSYPFPKIDPKDPLIAAKLMHNLDVGAIGRDDWEDNPINFMLFGRDNKLERTHVSRLLWKNYKGRCDNEPVGNYPVDYREVGVMVGKSPYDIAGFTGVKTRYVKPTMGDSLVTYIPSMRRIRRLSGTNTQDPLMGSDYTWDDWRGFWIKLHDEAYDLKAEYIGEEIQLVPAFTTTAKWVGSQPHMYWSKRPGYVVDFSVGGKYSYARQRLWIDKELFCLNAKNVYDRKERLWKKYYSLYNWMPESGLYSHNSNSIVDVINKHWTALSFGPVPHKEPLPDKYFSMESLLRMQK